MKKYFFILLLSLTTFAATARHSVSGIVTGYRDSAVAGVTVYIPEFEKSDETKAGGTYIIRNVGKGQVHIQFSKPGYKTILQQINTEDSALVLNVKMDPVLSEPEEATTLSGNPSLPLNVPYTVNDYSSTEYRQSGAVSLMSGLALQPGIDRISVGNGISKPSIRGLSLNHVQVREFGTPIGNDSWNETHDIGISENGIDHVEIIKGPAALMYGADAMGGVLIFEEQIPASAGTILGDVGLGVHSNPIGLEGELGFKGASAEGIFYSVRGGVVSHTSYIQGQNADEVKKNTEEKAFAPNSRWGNENAKISVGLSKPWGVSKLSYSFLHQRLGTIREADDNSNLTGGEKTQLQRERSYIDPYQDVMSNVVSSENTILTGKSSVNVNLAYQESDRNEYVENLSTQDENDNERLSSISRTTITYDVNWTSNPAKKYGVVVGTQGFMQTNDLQHMEFLVMNSRSLNDFGAFALLRYDFDKVNLFGGIRYDMRKQEFEYLVATEQTIDKDYSPLNGSLGASYHPLKNLTVKLNAASGYTTPNEIQMGIGTFPAYSNRIEFGNSDLKMEQNIESDLGLLFSSVHVDANISGFYNQISNYIFQRNTGLIYTLNDSLQHDYNIYMYSQDDATLTGGEVTFDVHPAPLKWFDLQLGYSMVKGELKSGGNVPYIPANKFTSSLTIHSKKLMWFFNPYLTIAGTFYSAQKDTAAFELVSESYSLFDVKIGLQLPFAHQAVDVSLSMTNMLNTPYMSHLSLVQNIGIRDMGRNVSLRIRIPFGVKGFSR